MHFVLDTRPNHPFNEGVSSSRTIVQIPAIVERQTPVEAFARAWSALRELAGSDAIYAVVAVPSGTGDVVGSGLGVRGTPDHLVIGRHDLCDLQLSDPGASLRHILARSVPGGGLRLLDLRTPTGLVDEAGHTLRGCVVDDLAIVRVATTTLIVARLDIIRPLVEARATAADALASLPERRYVGRPDAQSRTCLNFRPRLRLVSRQDETLIQRVPGTLRLGAVTLSDEGAVGAISLRTKRGHQSARVTASSLSRGVLIGRYDRCHTAGARLALPKWLSRVHLCLLLAEDGVWAIDLASKNGTTVDGEPIAALRLERRQTLMLAGDVTLEWETA